MSILEIIFIFVFLLIPKSANSCSVSITKNILESSKGSSNVQLVITNKGNASICSVKFFLSLPSGSSTESNRNMRSVGNNHYRTPANVRIEPGASYKEAGLVIRGNGMPKICVLKTRRCDHKKGNTTIVKSTTPSSRNNSTIKSTKNNNNQVTTATIKSSKIPSETTKPPPSNNNSTIKSTKQTNNQVTTPITPKSTIVPSETTTTQSTSGDSLVVPQVITTKDTCLSLSNASGIIDSELNSPIEDGIFTFYGAGGRGACGIDSDQPKMSAAASGSLFDSSAQWIPSCLSDQRVLLNDKICINKCVKITYNGKTLTVPITNKCPECPKNHVDLSQEAFLWLEPKGGVVGIARNAVITYITCPGQE
uniref:RlpA-like protein double-psi beta-barrel domain-containing protein n=2 Tax=Meloidogyne enterolobii TaxID=390850 RepID=A0A6V7UEH4_MELEN|nr:unnamed protein product [Meloidogyne enterolobii]